jgi:hypothetical protein
MRTSPAPFLAAYSPFADQHGNEIPSYRIYDANGDVVAETDSGKPDGQQEADAHLLAGAPDLRDALTEQTEAAQTVTDRWSQGDLAAAVRALDAAIAPARRALARAGTNEQIE